MTDYVVTVLLLAIGLVSRTQGWRLSPLLYMSILVMDERLAIRLRISCPLL